MWRIIIVLMIVGLCINTALALYGSGTEEDPWRIKSLGDFDEFAADANYWDDYTRLETDVNLAGRTYTTAVIAPDTNNSDWPFDGIEFTGVFDGNDHKITNLTIDGGAGSHLGLFGCVDFGEVINLGLESGSVSSGYFFVGGLMGENVYGSVSNCYYTGNVSGVELVGGLAGNIWLGSVDNCYFTGSVTGDVYVGGLIGANDGSISNCYSTGDVNGVFLVGGLVGYNAFIVSNCYSTCDVKGANDVGGLVGYNSGDPFLEHSAYIFNSYSNGSVYGATGVGGLVGQNGDDNPILTHPAYIFNSYSTGSVHGTSGAGGLVGTDLSGSFLEDIIASFWDVETSGQATSHGGTGLPTAQMQIKSTFTEAGWDFVEIWLINNGATYPVLRQEIRSDLNGDGGVDFADFAIFASHWLEGKGN